MFSEAVEGEIRTGDREASFPSQTRTLLMLQRCSKQVAPSLAVQPLRDETIGRLHEACPGLSYKKLLKILELARQNLDSPPECMWGEVIV